ncbi:MAG: GNAT family N-acetyltransferase [Candidatus Sericytochromatia bacterium]
MASTADQPYLIETGRLSLRLAEETDAPFILELLNDPGWIRFLGDRGVKSLEAAREYIHKLRGMYREHGFCLYVTELGKLHVPDPLPDGWLHPGLDRVPIGLCGLIKREHLADVDIGFALMERYWGRGLAFEAATGVMAYARDVLGLSRLVAITSPENQPSARLLTKLGMHDAGTIRPYGNDTEERLFVREFDKCL